MADAHSPPRRTINDLPTEVKARVVEICAAQDAAFRRMLVELRHEDAASGLLDALSALDGVHGRTVSALFRTSREWSSLAARWLFKVLKASRINTFFRYTISLTRLTYVTDLHLNDSTPTQAHEALSRACFLPHLDQLTLTGGAWRSLFKGEQWVYANDYASSPRDLAVRALQAALSRASRVIVVDFSGHELANFLTLGGPRLRSLHIEFSRAAGTQFGDKTDQVARTLGSAANLTELSISVKERARLPADFVGLVVHLRARKTLPQLRRLAVAGCRLDDSAVELCELFCNSLEALSLEVFDPEDDGDDDEDDDYEQPAFSAVFPCLTSLSLSARYGLDDTIDSLTPDLLPALKHIAFKLRRDPYHENGFPLDMFQQDNKLRAVDYPYLGHSSTRDLHFVSSFCHSRSIALSYLAAGCGPRLPVVWAKYEARGNLLHDVASGDPETPKVAASLVERTVVESVAFLEKRLAEVRATGDAAGLARLAAILRAVELERTAMDL
ncbi:hypothetical protein JCM10213_008846 [Rhodosporidiobolus nylandii]